MVWWWRRALVVRARERTRLCTTRSCVVLAPHPDDETLGCGATIARKRRAGQRVVVVIASDGRHSTRSDLVTPPRLAELRKEEALVATAILGVDRADVVLLGHEDRTLADNEDVLLERVAEIVDRVRPAEILTTSTRDRHPDHAAINRVARRIGAERPWCELAEYVVWYWYGGPLDPPSGTRDSLSSRRLRRLARVVWSQRPDRVSTRGFRSLKRDALEAYRSQTTRLTGESEWQVFPDGFADCFLGAHELFFPVRSTPAPPA